MKFIFAIILILSNLYAYSANLNQRESTDEIMISNFRVSESWTRPTKQAIYQKLQVNPSIREKIANGLHDIGYETPLAITAMYDIATVFPDKTAQVIAKKCKNYSHKSWEQIYCASKEVNEYLATKSYKELGRFNTACYTHAEAFSKVFNLLDIPRSNVGKVSANTTDPEGKGEPHVANRVTVTGINGLTYAYVIDVGWFPDQIFPYSKTAVLFHEKNSKTIKSNYILPNIPNQNAQPIYKFAPASQDSSNLNKDETGAK